jgi:DNA-binding CsgD family transcriptional regulator
MIILWSGQGGIRMAGACRPKGDFLGRREELDAVLRGLDALPGAGTYIHLSGPPGIGKTALLEMCAEEATRRGLRVLRAAGSQAEQGLPFAALHRLLRPLLHAGERLSPAQRTALLGAFGAAVVPAAEPARLGLASLELLSDSAAQVPLLVVVDDLQWLDPASREAVDFLSRRLAAEPIVLVVATREPPGPSPAPADGSAVHVPLSPLGAAEAELLLAQHVPQLGQAQRQRVLELAEGNPLALRELPLTALRGAPGLLPLTERLRDAFSARLEDCGTATRTLLLVAALLDGDLLSESEAAVRHLLGRPILARDRQEAVRCGLIEINDGRLQFLHPLMRSAVVSSTGPEPRAAAHRALAHALAADSDRGTWHLAAATDHPHAGVSSALEASADRALNRGAPTLALTLLRRASELTPQESASAHRLLRAAEIAFEVGRPETVRTLIDQVRARELPREDIGRLIALETAFDDGLPGGEALVHRLSAAAAEAVRAGDSEVAAHLLVRGARACYWGATKDPALLGRLREVADELTLSAADSRPTLLDAFLSPFSRGPAIVQRLGQWTATEHENPALTGLLAMASFVSGCFEFTMPLTAVAAEGLREQGRIAPLAQVLVLRAFASLYLGQWERSASAADEALRFAEETGQTTWAACAQLGLANLDAIRGREERAQVRLAVVQQAQILSGNASIANGIQLTRGLAALGQGMPGLAYDEFMRMLDPADPCYQSPQCVWVLDYFAEAAHAAGRREEALAVLGRIEHLAQSTTAGGVRRALALAHALLAEDEQAPQRFGAAREHCASSSPWYRARLDLAEGAWLRRRHRIAEGRRLLRAAQAAFDTLDAPAWAARAARELAASGETAERQRPGRWAALSPQELEIARLAGQGLSNREIGERLYLSHRTVGSHLYRLFPKLGVQTRAQLAAALTDSGNR